jgi:hypothetical protein
LSVNLVLTRGHGSLLLDLMILPRRRQIGTNLLSADQRACRSCGIHLSDNPICRALATNLRANRLRG